jgi:hypothetical protein
VVEIRESLTQAHEKVRDIIYFHRLPPSSPPASPFPPDPDLVAQLTALIDLIERYLRLLFGQLSESEVAHLIVDRPEPHGSRPDIQDILTQLQASRAALSAAYEQSAAEIAEFGDRFLAYFMPLLAQSTYEYVADQMRVLENLAGVFKEPLAPTELSTVHDTLRSILSSCNIGESDRIPQDGKELLDPVIAVRDFDYLAGQLPTLVGELPPLQEAVSLKVSELFPNSAEQFEGRLTGFRTEELAQLRAERARLAGSSRGTLAAARYDWVTGRIDEYQRVLGIVDAPSTNWKRAFWVCVAIAGVVGLTVAYHVWANPNDAARKKKLQEELAKAQGIVSH